MRSVFTRLMPILTLMRSAGVSRTTRAVKGSSSALPPSPRFTSWTPPAAAARAGQVVVGLAAFEPWLIELPWWTQVRRPSSVTGSTGASVRRVTSSVVSFHGSHSSTVFVPAGRPSKRTVPTGPG